MIKEIENIAYLDNNKKLYITNSIMCDCDIE